MLHPVYGFCLYGLSSTAPPSLNLSLLSTLVIGVMFQMLLNNIDVCSSPSSTILLCFPHVHIRSLCDSLKDNLQSHEPIHRFTLGIFIAGAAASVLLIRGTHKGRPVFSSSPHAARQCSGVAVANSPPQYDSSLSFPTCAFFLSSLAPHQVQCRRHTLTVPSESVSGSCGWNSSRPLSRLPRN
jgi:hypothetical protein